MMVDRRQCASEWDQKVECLFSTSRDAIKFRAVAHKVRSYVDGNGHE